MRRALSLVIPLALSLSPGPVRAAESAVFARGTDEIRPVVGATASMAGPLPQAQLSVGLDWARSLTPALAFTLGGWTGFAEEFVGAELHAGVKYRLLKLNPLVLPFVVGGAGFTTGFHRASGKENVLGFGVRGGVGFDVVVRPGVLVGLQLLVDLGPRFLPSLGILATGQVTVGVGFVR